MQGLPPGPGGVAAKLRAPLLQEGVAERSEAGGGLSPLLYSRKTTPTQSADWVPPPKGGGTPLWGYTFPPGEGLRRAPLRKHNFSCLRIFMSKKEFEPNFNTYDTYQTGVPEHPSKKSSVLIAVLLVLTIFLGGLASMLGLLNIRLLRQLQQAESTLPVDIYTNPSTTAVSSADLESDEPEPTAPLDPEASLELKLPPNRSEGKGLSPTEIYQVNESALVTVQATAEHATTKGVGVVMHAHGYILVNAHIVDAASRIYVQLADGAVYRATLVGADILTDLAVLYIQAEDLEVAHFGTSSYLQEDDFIASAEEPQQEPASGVITNALRKATLAGYSLQLIKTSISSCDGPLFNGYGQVVGMSSSRVPEVFSLHIKQGVGYAVPSVMIQEIANQLMQQGFVAGRPTLGLQTAAIGKVYQQYWDLPGGLRLLKVSDRAAAQGLEEDDILLGLGGQRLQSNADLYRVLLSYEIGDTLTAVVFRDGESITLHLTIFDTAE